MLLTLAAWIGGGVGRPGSMLSLPKKLIDPAVGVVRKFIALGTGLLRREGDTTVPPPAPASSSPSPEVAAPPKGAPPPPRKPAPEKQKPMARASKSKPAGRR